MENLSINRYGLKPGDIIKAKNNGIHRIERMEEVDGSIKVWYIQVYTDEGKPIVLNRLAECDISFCYPAFLEMSNIREKIKQYTGLLNYLQKLI